MAVRATRASISRSTMSLIVQPAPRMAMAPIAKRIIRSSGGKRPSAPLARAIDHQQGNSSSQIPIGRSWRAMRR